MSHPDERQLHEQPAQRSAFGGPRLELPRFQFAPSTPLARPSTPAPAPSPQLFVHAPARPAYAPAPVHAPVHAPVPVHAQVHVPSPAAQAMASVAATPMTLRPALQSASEPTLLQRITPIHMGMLLAAVMVVLVMTSGPGAVKSTPTRLPAVTVGGGGGVNDSLAGGVPMPARSGPTAVAAATANAPAPKAAPAPAVSVDRATAPRMLRVGSATLDPRVRAGGIPSPAAAANLAIAGGGRVASNQTDAVRMDGIPSPAASEQLGPQKLAFRPNDGATLPRVTGERDSHAVDSHYGGATLPMEQAAAPAMTPGASAAQAERQVAINQVTGGSATPPTPPAGGYALAY